MYGIYLYRLRLRKGFQSLQGRIVTKGERWANGCLKDELDTTLD